MRGTVLRLLMSVSWTLGVDRPARARIDRRIADHPKPRNGPFRSASRRVLWPVGSGLRLGRAAAAQRLQSYWLARSSSAWGLSFAPPVQPRGEQPSYRLGRPSPRSLPSAPIVQKELAHVFVGLRRSLVASFLRSLPVLRRQVVLHGSHWPAYQSEITARLCYRARVGAFPDLAGGLILPITASLKASLCPSLNGHRAKREKFAPVHQGSFHGKPVRRIRVRHVHRGSCACDCRCRARGRGLAGV